MNPGGYGDTRLSEVRADDETNFSPPKTKRIRLDDGCNNNLNSTLNSDSKSELRWTSSGNTSLVEPEILEDMGVSMLDDAEVSNESLKKLESQEFDISPTSSENSRQHQINNKENLPSQDMYRGSSCVSTTLDRLNQDPYNIDELGTYNSIGNESGYSSRVEIEPLGESRESFNKGILNNSQDKDALDNFFLYRRKKKTSVIGENKFDILSDEMILSILKWLPKKCLVRSMLVCKRWCQIARDEVLWSRLDLGGKVLCAGTLGHILPRGIQILRLAQAEIASPVFSPSSEDITEDYVSKLQYLDLSMAVIEPDDLATFLSKCRHLKKLSLENCTLNNSCCKAMSENKDLEVLNLTMCQGMDIECVKHLMKLRKLSALNAAWCSLDAESMTFLCKSLPSSINRLNIAGCRKTITDDNVKDLVKSCPDLGELDLSDCTMLTSNTAHYILSLAKLEHLSLNRCYSISPTTFSRLSYMPRLLYLDLFGLLNEPMRKSLQGNCGNTEINKFLFSSIARPTFGVRRTSIWGLRVRD